MLSLALFIRYFHSKIELSIQRVLYTKVHVHAVSLIPERQIETPAFDGMDMKNGIVSSAPQLSKKRKILEAFYIAKQKRRLNDQLKSFLLLLFRHGIT